LSPSGCPEGILPALLMNTPKHTLTLMTLSLKSDVNTMVFLGFDTALLWLLFFYVSTTMTLSITTAVFWLLSG